MSNLPQDSLLGLIFSSSDSSSAVGKLLHLSWQCLESRVLTNLCCMKTCTKEQWGQVAIWVFLILAETSFKRLVFQFLAGNKWGNGISAVRTVKKHNFYIILYDGTHYILIIFSVGTRSRGSGNNVRRAGSGRVPGADATGYGNQRLWLQFVIWSPFC